MIMERIICIKREFAPIVMHPQGFGYYLLWDYQPTMEKDENGNDVECDYGTCYQVACPYRKPTIELVEYLISNSINVDTDKKIYDGFIWEGNTVYLTTENQFNYKALYDICAQTNGANLPITLKLGKDGKPSYVTFETAESFRNFYYACVNYINQCVIDGWQWKDGIDYEVFKNYLPNIPDIPDDGSVLTNILGREEEARIESNNE